MQVNIQNSAPKQIHGLVVNPIESSVLKIVKNSKYGIEVKKEGNGIPNMQKSHGTQENGTQSNVKYAEKKNQPNIQRAQKYALDHVEQKKDFLVVLITYLECVKSATLNFLAINIKNKEHVLQVVLENLEDPIEVYDFEVEGDHCYYANGILVSNSDAFRYACVGIKAFGQASKLSSEQIKEMRMKHMGY